MATRGFYLAPHVFVDDSGDIWQYVDKGGLSGLPGLGDLSGTWAKIGEYFAPVVGAIGAAAATRIAGQGGRPQDFAPPVTGVQVGATSSGLFAGIDTTTLLLIAGLGVGAIMIMKK